MYNTHMAISYITDSTPTQVENNRVVKAVVVVNAALTGTIKVIDGTSGTTANVATITNPAAGSVYKYYNLNTGFRVIASGACDITAETEPSY